RLRSESRRQTPRQWSDVAEDLFVALNPRAAEQVALPDYIVESLASQVPSVRAGVIGELKRLAMGKHAGRAAAALHGLQELASNDDSRMVAAAAVEALQSLEGPEHELLE